MSGITFISSNSRIKYFLELFDPVVDFIQTEQKQFKMEDIIVSFRSFKMNNMHILAHRHYQMFLLDWVNTL